jgi:Protein of unknown function (DUF3419)
MPILFGKKKLEPMTSEAHMYIYATEMVGSYYAKIGLVGKSVLTIIGSGDQVIDAYYHGASQVVGFDLNRRSLLFIDLKITAIKLLDYAEFLTFFGHTFQDGSLAYETYLKLRNHLKEDSRVFFDGMYKELGSENPLTSQYFRNRTFLTISVTEVSAYLANEVAYLKVREIMAGNPSMELFACDIQELHEHMGERRVDVVNLSNVPNYFTGSQRGASIDDFLALLVKLAELLTSNGIIFFYSYSPLNYEGTYPEASSDHTRRKIEALGIFHVRQLFFPAISQVDKAEDKVTVLEKI